MSENRSGDLQDALEARHRDGATERYDFTLYVLGTTPKTIATIKRTREVCEQHLSGRYNLRVIDLYQHPGSAAENGIVATPTLVKQAPEPARRLIGTLADTSRVLHALGLAA